MIEESEKDSSPFLAYMAKEGIVTGVFSVLALISVVISGFLCPPEFDWIYGLALGIILALLAIAYTIKRSVGCFAPKKAIDEP